MYLKLEIGKKNFQNSTFEPFFIKNVSTYSSLSNNRAGWNKRAGWQNSKD